MRRARDPIQDSASGLQATLRRIMVVCEDMDAMLETMICMDRPREVSRDAKRRRKGVPAFPDCAPERTGKEAP